MASKVAPRELSFPFQGIDSALCTPIRMVGSGGSKRVWKVVYHPSGECARVCALAAFALPTKEQYEGYSDDEIEEEMKQQVSIIASGAKRERDILAELKGCNSVVSLESSIEMRTDSGHVIPYLVLNYFSEGNLATYLKTHPLSKEVKIRIIMELLEGLSHCHKLGYFVADLKNENILVTVREDGVHAAIGDLGNAFKTADKKQLNVDVYNMVNSVFLTFLDSSDGAIFTYLNGLVKKYSDIEDEFPSANSLIPEMRLLA